LILRTFLRYGAKQRKVERSLREQLFATKQRSDATHFHVSKLAQRCRDRSTGFQVARRKQQPGSRQRDVLSRRLHDPHPVRPKAGLFCVISIIKDSSIPQCASPPSNASRCNPLLSHVPLQQPLPVLWKQS